MHVDGIEHMHLALYEVSPMQNQWDSSSKDLLHFLDLLCEFRQE